jgi:osmotically-inducible protein OsmY
MDERERNQPYYGRHEGGHDFRDERFGRGREPRERDDASEARRPYGRERMQGRDYESDRDTMLGRHRAERRYEGERGRGGRYGRDAQALPNVYGSYDERIDRDDAERSRGWPYERRGLYGQGDYGERNYVDERPEQYRDRYAEAPYGADWRGGTRSRGYERDDSRYGERGFAQGDYYQRGDYYPRRDWPERNLEQGAWGERRYGERDHRERGYGEQDYRGAEYGRGRAESFGQQLREAGQHMAQKVKRAFRGPKGYKRSDERIREDICDRFAEQNYLDPSEIEVAVSNGEVTLSGTVEFRNEKFVAEELADDVSGVTAVYNQLRLRREQAPRAGEVATPQAAPADAARTRNARA